jgi:hypothetical protein
MDALSDVLRVIRLKGGVFTFTNVGTKGTLATL